jgi:hypothetical protein
VASSVAASSKASKNLSYWRLSGCANQEQHNAYGSPTSCSTKPRRHGRSNKKVPSSIVPAMARGDHP